MRKRTEREIQRQSRWQEIVQGQRQSGQSVAAYCRQAGVTEPAFYWWRRELARRDGQRDSQPSGCGRRGRPARSARRTPSGALAGVRFLPVQVAAQRDVKANQPIEIVLDGQRVLRVPPGFDRQTLLDVLGTLEGRGC